MNWSDQAGELQKSFANDGYLLIQQALPPEFLGEVQENVDRFLREIVPALSREQVYYEQLNDCSTIKQIPHLDQYDDYFDRFQKQGPLYDLAEVLIDAPVRPEGVQYFNKPPAVGQPTPPHQDGYYFMLTPCDALTVWIPLEDVDKENGCVSYIQGSHRQGMRSHGKTETLGFSQGITDYGPEDQALEVAVPTTPGDLLVHHALTIHGAGGNHSTTRTRKALGIVYFAQHAREDTAAQEAYQRKLTEERIAAGKL